MAGEKSTFKDLQTSISAALIETTRTIGQIANEDLSFHRSSVPTVGPILDRQASRLLNIAQGLLKVATLGTEVPTPQLQDADSVEESWSGIVDVIDNLLEKSDACIDEYTGVIKKSTAVEDRHSIVSPRKQPLQKKTIAPKISKPQNGFLKPSRNNETTPFKPLLSSKPHAIIPFVQSLKLVTEEDGLERYPNPYQHEITMFNYPEAVYTKSDPINFPPFASTQAEFVDTPEAVTAMIEELRKAKEIAIDLEHHDAHSYIGLVCLMQISTRDKDWIVDTLKPWREDLQALNEIFTNPNIVKVLHGAFMDMIWLQRDLGLYVVGLFDTFHASRCLGYPRNSLAALLKKFVDFDAEKQYQMADWRIRPLPQQMYNYARSDTHFLLFVYDHLRNELLDKSDVSVDEGNLITQVLEKSKIEALQRYERSFYDEERGKGPGGWYNMLERTPALFNKEQFAVFRAVHQWRDRTARLEDEGTAQVMPKHVLYEIARRTPMDIQSLLGCSHPISPVLRLRTDEVLQVIKKARLAGANGPEMKDLMKPLYPDLQVGKASSVAISDPPISNGPGLGHVLRGLISLKSNISRFWGSLLDDASSTYDQTEAQMRSKGLRLVLPLPQLTAAVLEPQVGVDSPSQELEATDPGARAAHQHTTERKRKESNFFVVKQLGGSRKRKAGDTEKSPEYILQQRIQETAALDGSEDDQEHLSQSSIMADKENQVNGDSSETGPLEASTQLSKGQRKRARKRAEAQRMSEAARAGEDPTMKAFDYAAAPSVLHSKKNQIDRTGVKQPFDPYAKSLIASNGIRNFKNDSGGKSFTYKNQ